MDWITDANISAGNSQDGNTNLSFTEASISEEPSAVIPYAEICVWQTHIFLRRQIYNMGGNKGWIKIRKK
ncbi:MAG: hypothetical protein KAH35_04235 [Candidatus Atribacteria bacterium]|nr:hypothetical protein [Candidatus Atribacteria bacterium]